MRLATQRGTQQFWRTFWRTGSVSTTLVIEDTLLFLRYIISNREFRSIRIESFPFCISIFYSITRAHTFFLFRVDRSRSIREERRKKERAGWWSYCCLLSRLERNESVIGDLPSSLSASTNREKQLLRIDIRIEHDHFERWFEHPRLNTLSLRSREEGNVSSFLSDLEPKHPRWHSFQSVCTRYLRNQVK